MLTEEMISFSYSRICYYIGIGIFGRLDVSDLSQHQLKNLKEPLPLKVKKKDQQHIILPRRLHVLCAYDRKVARILQNIFRLRSPPIQDATLETKGGCLKGDSGLWLECCGWVSLYNKKIYRKKVVNKSQVSNYSRLFNESNKLLTKCK